MRLSLCLFYLMIFLSGCSQIENLRYLDPWVDVYQREHLNNPPMACRLRYDMSLVKSSNPLYLSQSYIQSSIDRGRCNVFQ